MGICIICIMYIIYIYIVIYTCDVWYIKYHQIICHLKKKSRYVYTLLMWWCERACVNVRDTWICGYMRIHLDGYGYGAHTMMTMMMCICFPAADFRHPTRAKRINCNQCSHAHFWETCASTRWISLCFSYCHLLPQIWHPLPKPTRDTQCSITKDTAPDN